MSASELRIVVTKDGSLPYAENAGGDVLSTFNQAVLGQLLLTTSTFELKAALLKSWKWNEDDRSYDLFLREDLFFHDNTPVQAEDLEFALLRGFFSKNQSFYNIYLSSILGVDEIKPSTTYRSGLVEGIKIINPFTIKVKLKNANPSFLYALTRPFFSFSKRSALNDDLITWKKWPIGAGAYKVESEDEEKITLLRNQNASERSIKRIFLYKKVTVNKEYDISFFELKNMKTVFKTANPSAVYALFYTNQNELSLKSDFRNAVKYGVDRKEITEQDDLIRPSYEFLTAKVWKSDASIKTDYDLEKSKYYFSRLPENLRNKTWPIPVYSFGALSKIATVRTNFLKSQFSKFGFKVNFYPSPEKFLIKSASTDSPMTFSGRVCNNIDPLLMFSSFQTGSAYLYDNAQNDKNFDSLYCEAQLAVTVEDRAKTLRNLSKYTIDHNFMVPLFEDVQHYYYNPKTIAFFGNQDNSITLFLDEICKK